MQGAAAPAARDSRGALHVPPALAARPRGPRRAVERLDRRGIEPFELFTSEFGQNSFKIQYILLEFVFLIRIFQHVRKYL